MPSPPSGQSARVALVSGVSGAIGRAIAEKLARAGVALAVTGLEADLLNEAASSLRRIGVPVFAEVADLADRAQTRRFVENAREAYPGGITTLVTNAGMSFKEPVRAITEANFDHQLEVNFSAPFWLAHALVDDMESAEGGSIVFISSTGALAAHPNSAVYDSAKSALEGLTRALAVELGPLGIRVNAVQPGHVVNGTDVPRNPDSNGRAHWSTIPLGRPGEPEDVAELVEFLCTERAAYISGTVLRVDGGRGARSPIVVAPIPEV